MMKSYAYIKEEIRDLLYRLDIDISIDECPSPCCGKCIVVIHLDKDIYHNRSEIELPDYIWCAIKHGVATSSKYEEFNNHLMYDLNGFLDYIYPREMDKRFMEKPKLIHNWPDLLGMWNEKYYIDVNLDIGGAKIIEKATGRTMVYLPTHSLYYSNLREDYTKILRSFGFNVALIN